MGKIADIYHIVILTGRKVEKMFDLDRFIAEYVTKRPVSMFYNDIQKNKETLTEKIKGKSVLVIGGAGSIGSSFIKAILPFEPATLVVVDINETWRNIGKRCSICSSVWDNLLNDTVGAD